MYAGSLKPVAPLIDQLDSRYNAVCALAKSFPDRLSLSLRCAFETASECGASG